MRPFSVNRHVFLVFGIDKGCRGFACFIGKTVQYHGYHKQASGEHSRYRAGYKQNQPEPVYVKSLLFILYQGMILPRNALAAP